MIDSFQLIAYYWKMQSSSVDNSSDHMLCFLLRGRIVIIAGSILSLLLHGCPSVPILTQTLRLISRVFILNFDKTKLPSYTLGNGVEYYLSPIYASSLSHFSLSIIVQKRGHYIFSSSVYRLYYYYIRVMFCCFSDIGQENVWISYDTLICV